MHGRIRLIGTGRIQPFQNRFFGIRQQLPRRLRILQIMRNIADGFVQIIRTNRKISQLILLIQ